MVVAVRCRPAKDDNVMTKLSVGFYVRNAFQVKHLRPLFAATPDATWALKFERNALAYGIAEDRYLASALRLRRTLSQFDVVVSHAAPPQGRRLRNVPWVMVQYGYAKGAYNFGPWRKTAQLILAYGEYAAARFRQHAPVAVIGNPMWDSWTSDEADRSVALYLRSLTAKKPVILYAPTWGPLGSAPTWLDDVARLSSAATVLVKAHHNEVVDLNAYPDVHEISHIELIDALAVADVMISDYSGAIFDAVMCDVPVVMIDRPDVDQQFGDKVDADSPEIVLRDRLGGRVATAADLPGVVSAAVQGKHAVDADLKAELFARPPSVVGAFTAALDKLVAD